MDTNIKRLLVVVTIIVLGYLYVQRQNNHYLSYSPVIDTTSPTDNNEHTSDVTKTNQRITITPLPITTNINIPSTPNDEEDDDDNADEINGEKVISDDETETYPSLTPTITLSSTSSMTPSSTFIPSPSSTPSSSPTSTPSSISTASIPIDPSRSTYCLDNELVYVGNECIYSNPPTSISLRVDENYLNHQLTTEPLTTISNYITGRNPESSHRCATWKSGKWKTTNNNPEDSSRTCTDDLSTLHTYEKTFPKITLSLYPSEIRAYTSLTQWLDAPVTSLSGANTISPSPPSTCSNTNIPYCGWKYLSEINTTILNKRYKHELFRGYLYDPNDSECCLPPYMHYRKRKQCLSGERIAMVGDSMMRQLYTQMITTIRGLHYAFDFQHHYVNRHIMNWESKEDTYQPCITAQMVTASIANDITHIWPPNFPPSFSTDTTFFWNPLFQDGAIDDAVFQYKPTVLVAGLHYWEEKHAHYNLNAIRWLIKTLQQHTTIRKVFWTLPPCWGPYYSKKRPNAESQTNFHERTKFLQNALSQIIQQTNHKRSGSLLPFILDSDVSPIPEVQNMVLPDNVELMIVNTCHISNTPIIDPYRNLDGFHFTCIANPEGSPLYDWMAGPRTSPAPLPSVVALPPIFNDTCSDPYTYNIVRQMLNALCNP